MWCEHDNHTIEDFLLLWIYHKDPDNANLSFIWDANFYVYSTSDMVSLHPNFMCGKSAWLQCRAVELFRGGTKCKVFRAWGLHPLSALMLSWETKENMVEVNLFPWQ